VGCGKWNRPTMKNPAYKGIWAAEKIVNPLYKGNHKDYNKFVEHKLFKQI
jgi:hypothetical protein